MNTELVERLRVAAGGFQRAYDMHMWVLLDEAANKIQQDANNDPASFKHQLDQAQAAIRELANLYDDIRRDVIRALDLIDNEGNYDEALETLAKWAS